MNVVKERGDEIAKEKRKLEMIFDSVKYFKKKMKANIEDINNIVEVTKSGLLREEEDWSKAIESLRESFDETRYMNETLI